MQDHLTDQQWQTFESLGCVPLGAVVTDEELTGLQERIDEIMMGTAPVPYDRMMLQLDTTTGIYKDMSKQTKGHKGATLAYRKMEGLEFDPLFLSYMQKPLFRDMCDRAYGQGIPVTTYRAMFMNKPARQGTVLPWHMDAFRNMDRPPFLTAWMALDDSTKENGCVTVLPGSHRHIPKEDPTVFLTDEQVAEAQTKYPPTLLECKAGEGFLLHNRLLHSSEVNSTDTPRRAFSACYMDGRAKGSVDREFSIIFGEEALRPKTVGPALV